MTDLRVGQGFDVHPWSDDADRALILGGVRFEGVRGLSGHSDADVVAHALIDAILGAAGLGDIGQLFPDTDDAHAGADSLRLLEVAAEELSKHGWRTLNADCTVIVDEPKLAPQRLEMQALLSAAIGGPVSVKGKRTEGMAGLQGGITCHAVALITRTAEMPGEDKSESTKT